MENGSRRERLRIKDIEKGRYVNIKILPNSKESIKLTYELFGKVKYEVLIMLPSLNGFFRTEKSYGFKILNGLASKGIKVKVLSPLDYKNQAKVDQINLIIITLNLEIYNLLWRL